MRSSAVAMATLASLVLTVSAKARRAGAIVLTAAAVTHASTGWTRRSYR